MLVKEASYVKNISQSLTWLPLAYHNPWSLIPWSLKHHGRHTIYQFIPFGIYDTKQSKFLHYQWRLVCKQNPVWPPGRLIAPIMTSPKIIIKHQGNSITVCLLFTVTQSLKRKGRQGDCPTRHLRRWSQVSTSPVTTRAVTLTIFPFLW